jgi:ATP/maltotriose-dependent transcriptional regulator MalT
MSGIPVDFERLAGAGRRALGAGDMRVAVKLLELASALARDRRERLQLVPDLGVSLEEIGKLRRAEQVFAEVARTSDLARFEVASLRDYTKATPESFEKLEEAAKPRPGLRPAERARALILEAEVKWTKGKYGEMNKPLEEAKNEIENLDPEQQPLFNSILGWKARAMLLGPMKAADAIKSCDKFEREHASRSSVRAVVLAVRAGLGAMQNEIDQARTDYEESRRIGEAFGLNAWLAALPLYSGPVELLDGQAAEAERQLRRGYEALESMGDRSRRATTAAFLAHALYDQGKNDEAKHFALKSKELGADDDIFTEVTWRGALAKALARLGDCTSARDLAKEAAEKRAPSKANAPNLRGDAFLDYAEVLRLCKRPRADARAKATTAAGLYHAKGNIVAESRANALIERLP